MRWILKVLTPNKKLSRIHLNNQIHLLKIIDLEMSLKVINKLIADIYYLVPTVIKSIEKIEYYI
jgi:hypothetical protein